MKRTTLYTLAAVLAGTAAFNAQAADKFIGDKAHTEVVFGINHLGFSTTYGKFKDVESEFIYDAENPSKSSVTATIKAASIELGHEGKNDHMRANDFFAVEKFPDITFKSTKVSSAGEDKLTVVGDLTILGNTHPVTLDVKVNKIGKHPFFDKQVGGFSARTKLDRTQWGLSAYAPAVGAEVDIRIEIEGEKVVE